MNAQDFADELDNPCVFFAGVGCPGGMTIALLPDTDLPFDLSEIEGEVKDGVFEANNLADPDCHNDQACGWKFSDWNGNTVYKVQVLDDFKAYREQNED